MFECYRRRRNLPTPESDLFIGEDESNSDTDDYSETSCLPTNDRKSDLKVEKAISRLSTREALGKHDEAQEVMAKVNKSLQNMAVIERRIREMTTEIALEKTARVKAETQLTAILDVVEKGQMNASRLAGGNRSGKDEALDNIANKEGKLYLQSLGREA